MDEILDHIDTLLHESFQDQDPEKFLRIARESSPPTVYVRLSVEEPRLLNIFLLKLGGPATMAMGG